MENRFAEHQMRRRSLKTKLEQRALVFAGWVSYREPAIAETFAMAGMDFVAIDMEHTTSRPAKPHKSFLLPTRKTVFVCQDLFHQRRHCEPLLESAADGLIFPVVETPNRFKRFWPVSSFPQTGLAAMVSTGHGFGLSFDDYITSWNETGR